MKSFLWSFFPFHLIYEFEEHLTVTGRKYGHLVWVNCLGGLSLPRNSEVRSTDHPDTTIAVYRGCKAATHSVQTYFVLLIPFGVISGM